MIKNGVSADHRQWAMFIHLSLLAGHVVPLAGFVVPIVLWQMKKEESEFIDENGRMAVNWFMTEFVYLLVGLVLCLAFIGIPLIFALIVVGIVFPIVGGLKANDGIAWKYPMVIRFFS